MTEGVDGEDRGLIEIVQGLLNESHSRFFIGEFSEQAAAESVVAPFRRQCALHLLQLTADPVAQFFCRRLGIGDDEDLSNGEPLL